MEHTGFSINILTDPIIDVIQHRFRKVRALIVFSRFALPFAGDEEVVELRIQFHRGRLSPVQLLSQELVGHPSLPDNPVHPA